MDAPFFTPLNLNGAWSLRLDPERIGEEEAWYLCDSPNEQWRVVTVPGAWEEYGIPKNVTGPVWYLRTIPLPPEWDGRRITLHFGGVSFNARVWANGVYLGEHRGIWDSFSFDVTPVLDYNRKLCVILEVEKPGGRFPLRETLAGFYPYVSHSFGGIWREVFLEATGPARIAELYPNASAEGDVEVEVTLDSVREGGARLHLEVLDKGSQVVARGDLRIALTVGDSQSAAVRLRIPRPVPWSPDDPYLYTLNATLFIEGEVSDSSSVRFGARSIQVEGDSILLNGRPVYPRGILNWGWYPPRQAPDSAPLFLAEEFARLREMGFNTMKHCLWVPPAHHLRLADELGFLVWMELPLWAPDVTEANRNRIPREYERIVRQIRHHPSIVLWTLGCELNRNVDEDLLGDLYNHVKALTGNPLVRDNSGSAECYGGNPHEYADYYDYHFYCDLNFFQPTVRSFLPHWRTRQPWLFGEYCDSDTFRDLPALNEADNGNPPWWTVADEATNPQGVRWEYAVTDQMDRLQANGLMDRREELNHGSRQQALLHRKMTVEWTRGYREMSGYVVTGLRDTPITTAGVFDDFNEAKWPPELFHVFNRDTVLFIGWDRRREWRNGGDRPSYIDPYNYWPGERVRAHIGISHYGRETGIPETTWRVTDPDGSLMAMGRLPNADFYLSPGDVTELGIVEFIAPEVEKPTKATLVVDTKIGEERTQNEWPLWFYPSGAYEGLPTPIGLYDPAGHFVRAERHGLTVTPVNPSPPAPLPQGERGESAFPWSGSPLLIAAAWTPEIRDYIRGGGRAVVMALDAQNPLPTFGCPFWREAMKLFESHPLWDRFPHEDFTDLQFYGLAADLAFETDALSGFLGPDAVVRPVLRRVDARSLAVHCYLMDVSLGQGRAFFTTLRIPGGNGDQPSGFFRHTGGAWFLACLLHLLAKDER
ncbi:MAG: glycoside hydrolase [Armatimonadetes bacterium]|nr:glycoside hydrolase [Armatimonadota bacterium]